VSIANRRGEQPEDGRNGFACVPEKKEQHLRPLAPGLPRRPWAAAYGLGPSVFTIRARRSGTDRASVSQAVACRGAPPLPAMSLGTCRCCRGKQNSRGEAGIFPRARGDGPGPGGTWFAGGRGPAAGAKRRWGKYRVDRGPISDDRKNLLVLTVVGHPSSISGSGARGRGRCCNRVRTSVRESKGPGRWQGYHGL